MKYIVILMLLVLGGCAAYPRLIWEHPQGFDADQRLQAQQECRELAHREARYQSFFYGDLFFPFHRSFYYHDRHYPSSTFWYEHHRQLKYQDDLDRFYHLCMEAKGWRLIPLEQEVPVR